MVPLLLLLVLIAILFGVGAFVVKWLLIVAVVLALVWLIGFLARGPEAHWYRW